ncbi:hypothetical protein ACN27E_17475 [Mycobacterium sp. WMMD1722]|uniref:hypothetical protein n=1 Tax=Mycobacterium sp. WMMD1722 TaxID=3404117 RepID=UPI003BF49B88
MKQVERARSRREVWALRSGVAAAALCAGMALAPAAGVAWAETADSTNAVSASGVSAGPAATGPAATGSASRTGVERSTASRRADQTETSNSVSSAAGDAKEPDRAGARQAAADRGNELRVTDTGESPPARLSAEPTAPTRETHVEPLTARRADEPAATAVGVVDTRPAPPQPLSPIAELIDAPGRAVNTVLQALDLTASTSGPESPISFAPINSVVFGTFRELERAVGLWETPPTPPALPPLTYTGPTTRPTPTVAQFLDASSAAYVLGSTPGGMKPFTVNGFQMSATNILTGMAADVWVTPQAQIIIAYQGTTGGTNLLFNPFIAISQIIADLQMILTPTTPPGFYSALDFARQVQAQAAVLGYDPDDVFVTGHSLGGWQAQFVAQHTGLAGIGFESPGMNTTVPGNGADAMFVNIATYGDTAPFMSTDLPGLEPIGSDYVPGGGNKPHYGPIVMIGDPAAMTPLYNASALWGTSLLGSLVYFVDFFGNFFQYHLPPVQAYYLGIAVDPTVLPWLGSRRGPVLAGYGNLTIPQLLQAASDDGILFRP